MKNVNKKNVENLIKIPKLHPYNPYLDKYHSRRYHLFRPKNLWDPEIDGDFLAYINHNIVCVEDIYNNDKGNNININNTREEEIKPIEAKEIFYDNNNSNISEYNTHNTNENDNKDDKRNKSMDNDQKKDLSNIQEEEEVDNKIKNKFCEFKDRHPNLIEISLLVDPAKNKQNAFHNELKDFYYERINEVGEFSEDIFPPKGIDLKTLKIYRYALNNERNEEKSVDSFTILRTAKSTPPQTPKNKRIGTTMSSLTRRKKTIIHKNKKRKLTDDHLYNKKTIRESLNINIKMNSSDFLIKKTNGKENEEENIIKNKYSSEKDNIKYNDKNLEKQTFSDKLNKIFNCGSFKENDENNEKCEKNENIKKSENIESNKNFEMSLFNDINNESNIESNNENNIENNNIENNNIENNNIENNKEIQNQFSLKVDENINNSSDESNSRYKQGSKIYALNLSSSNQNSED